MLKNFLIGTRVGHIFEFIVFLNWTSVGHEFVVKCYVGGSVDVVFTGIANVARDLLAQNLFLFFTIRNAVVIVVISLTLISIIDVIGVLINYFNVATTTISIIEVYDVVILGILLQAFIRTQP
jgi:hypothetical protein